MGWLHAGASEAGTNDLPSLDETPGGSLDRFPPILVAEDNADARVMLARLVRKLRVLNPVDFAEDGRAAIDYLAAVLSGDRPAPVVVLLDLNMPRASGLEVLRWLRGESRLAATPVVVLTGSAEMDQVRECHELGVASYLVKPVGFTAFSDVLRGLDLRWALFPSP